MLRDALAGTVAGAAGTVTLDIFTYGDMVLRGRPSSEVPAKLAGILTSDMGIKLTRDGQDAAQHKQHRQTGLGSLLGYATGLGVGTIYGIFRPRLDTRSQLFLGMGIGLAAMVASDLPATLAKVTNPAKWKASDWISDIVPHLAYGVVTAFTYKAMMQPRADVRSLARTLQHSAKRAVKKQLPTPLRAVATVFWH